jgi:hypothetical protein
MECCIELMCDQRVLVFVEQDDRVKYDYVAAANVVSMKEWNAGK